MEKYSLQRTLKPSRPSVIFSPLLFAKSFAPVSTLIPGCTPMEDSASGIERPSVIFCLIVSSKRITPLIESSYPLVAKRLVRYDLLVSEDAITPTASSRLDIVPLLSSAARIPLPAATKSRAVFSSSRVSI